MDLYFLKIDRKNFEHTYLNKDILTQRAVSKLNKSSNHMRRLHIIYSDLLLQYVLFKHQRKKRPIDITYNHFGKPFLEEGYFNISHCEEWILCGYSEKNIGVDIEKYKTCNHALVNFFFTGTEKEYIKKLSEDEETIFFTDSWTFKESYVKVKGISLFNIKNSVETPKTRAYFEQRKVSINREEFHYVCGRIEEYSWCVISESNFINYKTKIVSYNDLMGTLIKLY